MDSNISWSVLYIELRRFKYWTGNDYSRCDHELSDWLPSAGGFLLAGGAEGSEVHKQENSCLHPVCLYMHKFRPHVDALHNQVSQWNRVSTIQY